MRPFAQAFRDLTCCLLTVSTLGSVAVAQSAGESIGAGIQEAATQAQLKQVRKDIRSKSDDALKVLWDQVRAVYPYLGERGLLLQRLVVSSPAGKPSFIPDVKFVGVAIVGSGATPGEAWALGAPLPIPSGSEAENTFSGFWWVKPRSGKWPAAAPEFEKLQELGLIEPDLGGFRSTTNEGLAIRGRFIADSGFAEAARLEAIRSIAAAAEARAKTAELRKVAADLAASAAEAKTRLNEINANLARELSRVARAQDALKILDGLQVGVGAVSSVANSLAILGDDAPKSPRAELDEAGAREYAKSLSDKASVQVKIYGDMKTKLQENLNTNEIKFNGEFRELKVLEPREIGLP